MIPRTLLRRRAAGAAMVLGLTGLAALAHYELASHGRDPWGSHLPGWAEARQIDLVTPWSPLTGLAPLDRALHEGHEALLYYRTLLGRPVDPPRRPHAAG